MQNVYSREKFTLDVLWNIIITPLENGYYNHRWEPKRDGYFMNRKMQNPSGLIEYDFDTDVQIMIPSDWNTQMEKLYYGIGKQFNDFYSLKS